MSSTASNYYKLIDQNYPVRGVDNDSQGFRDNFKNIVGSLKSLDLSVSNLELNSIRKDQESATFYGNTIDDVNLNNWSQTFVDNDVLTDTVTIDYKLGNYQKFELATGLHPLVVKNWPGTGKTGLLRLSVTPSDTTYTAIEFPSNYIDLGPEENPYELTPGIANIFEIWNEQDSDNVFVRKLSQHVYSTSTVTHAIMVDVLNIGGTNRYTAGTVLGSQYATQVQANSKISNMALVPNRVITQPTTVTTDSPADTVATTFGVASAKGIYQGAKINFVNTFTTYTVQSVDVVNNKVTVDPAFPVGIGTGNVTFTNPVFTDQPTILTLGSGFANTTTGIISAVKGALIASQNKLEFTFNDYGGSGPTPNINTFKIETLPVSTATANNSKILADTMFVHSVLPFGSVIMWWGQKKRIPYGWALCDGGTYKNPTTGNNVTTPDLRNMFVVGGTDDYYDSVSGTWTGSISTVDAISPTSIGKPTGGSANTIVAQHKHGATISFQGGELPKHTHSVTVTDPGHGHEIYTSNENGGSKDPTGAPATDASQPFSYKLDYNGNLLIKKSTTGLDGTNIKLGEAAAIATTGTILSSIEYAGEDPTGKNVPPYRALYYIMKISGPEVSGAGHASAWIPS